MQQYYMTMILNLGFKMIFFSISINKTNFNYLVIMGIWHNSVAQRLEKVQKLPKFYLRYPSITIVLCTLVTLL